MIQSNSTNKEEGRGKHSTAHPIGGLNDGEGGPASDCWKRKGERSSVESENNLRVLVRAKTS